jgi:hypothetical protein
MPTLPVQPIASTLNRAACGLPVITHHSRAIFADQGAG